MMSILLPVLLLAPQGVGKLDIAKGTVESRVGAEGEFKPLNAGDAVEPGTWLRTGAKTLAAFRFSEGSDLRLNENTEVLLTGPRGVEIKNGRIFVKVLRGAGEFNVKTEFTTVRIDVCEMDLIYAARVPNGPPAKAEIAVFEGMAAVPAKGYAAPQRVTAGWQCDMNGTVLNTVERINSFALYAKWMYPLLAERGPSKEAEGRCRQLFLALTRAPKNSALEEELKILGQAGLPSLAAELRKPGIQNDPARGIVARIVGDGATLPLAPDLVAILKDPDPEVRVQAAGALARLAGNKDQGFDARYWRADKLEAGQKAWEDWLSKNRK